MMGTPGNPPIEPINYEDRQYSTWILYDFVVLVVVVVFVAVAVVVCVVVVVVVVLSPCH